MTKSDAIGTDIFAHSLVSSTIGWFAGLGLEDILTNIAINERLAFIPIKLPPVIIDKLDYFSLYGAAAGALIGVGISVLKCVLKKGYIEELIVESESFTSSTGKNQSTITEDLINAPIHLVAEGITPLVDELTTGLQNHRINDLLTDYVSKGVIEKAKKWYYSKRNNVLYNWAGAFNSFKTNRVALDPKGQTINPKYTLDRTFRIVDWLYKNLGNAVVLRREHEINPDLKAKAREKLQDLTNCLKDVSVWITYLSKNEGIVGRKVRKKLSEKYGIDHPESLYQDACRMSNRLLEVYDAITLG